MKLLLTDWRRLLSLLGPFLRRHDVRRAGLVTLVTLFVIGAILGTPQARSQLVVPVLSTVTIPTNAFVNLTIITNVSYVTNLTVFIVTNFFQTNVSSGVLTALTGNVIDPALGLRLVKVVTGPLVFTLAAFADTNWTTVYLKNPGRFPVTWPSTNLVDYGGVGPATNDFRPILFENIFGQFIGSQ